VAKAYTVLLFVALLGATAEAAPAPLPKHPRGPGSVLSVERVKLDAAAPRLRLDELVLIRTEDREP
jgi:hypothetical protein